MSLYHGDAVSPVVGVAGNRNTCENRQPCPQQIIHTQDTWPSCFPHSPAFPRSVRRSRLPLKHPCNSSRKSKGPGGLLGEWQICPDPGKGSVSLLTGGPSCQPGGTRCFGAGLPGSSRCCCWSEAGPCRLSGPPECSFLSVPGGPAGGRHPAFSGAPLGVQRFRARDSHCRRWYAGAGSHQPVRTKC